jgi:hypothetical protein
MGHEKASTTFYIFKRWWAFFQVQEILNLMTLPTTPVLFCIAFPQNLYHLVKGCSLHSGDSPDFCV